MVFAPKLGNYYGHKSSRARFISARYRGTRGYWIRSARRVIFCVSRDETSQNCVVLIGRDSASKQRHLLAVVICDLYLRLDAIVRLQCSVLCAAKSCEMILVCGAIMPLACNFVLSATLPLFM